MRTKVVLSYLNHYLLKRVTFRFGTVVINMKKKIKLFGNDSSRPLFIDLEDLHPGSALKKIIEKDVINKRLRVNMSRDVLHSMITSYRHGEIILTKKTSIRELHFELRRDCTLFNHVYSSKLESLCCSIAHEITSWKRLNEGMNYCSNGLRTEWDTTTTLCCVSFVPKPKICMQSNIFKKFVHIVLYKTINDDLEDCNLFDIIQKVDYSSPLKYITADDSLTSKNVGTKHTLCNTMVESILTLMIEDNNSDITQFCNKCITLYNYIPDFHKIFASYFEIESAERECFNMTVSKSGFEVKKWLSMTRNSNLVPLLFPTEWIQNDSRWKNNPSFFLERHTFFS